jgi:hypothetical protein
MSVCANTRVPLNTGAPLITPGDAEITELSCASSRDTNSSRSCSGSCKAAFSKVVASCVISNEVYPHSLSRATYFLTLKTCVTYGVTASQVSRNSRLRRDRRHPTRGWSRSSAQHPLSERLARCKNLQRRESTLLAAPLSTPASPMFPRHSRSSRDFLELRQELPKVREKLANDHEKVVIDEEKFSIDDDIFAYVVKALPTLMKSFSPSTNFS